MGERLSESELRDRYPIDQAVNAAISVIALRVEDPKGRNAFMAWLKGAGVVALIVLRGGFLSRVWGEGDIAKAMKLTKLFALHMVSVYYRVLAKQSNLSPDQQWEACKAAATELLALFSDASEETIREYRKRDLQFNYDIDLAEEPEKREPGKNFYACYPFLLLAAAHEACSGVRVDWHRVTVPVESLAKLVGQAPTAVFPGMKHHLHYVISMRSAANYMFEELSRGAQQIKG
ncbi:MAG: hypothetical protein HYX89_07545 [Chloroflexi bacterium]|nr:hypothetical protein [Chloroflexota bacterium]